MNVVDLTLTLKHGSRGYEPHPHNFFNQVNNIEEDGYNLSQIILNSHVGTHIDAPYHFLEDGKTLEELDVNDLVGQACVLDFTNKGARDMITAQELEAHDDLISKHEIVLLRTDWYKEFPGDRYLNDMPNVSLGAAEYLVSKKIKLLGIETASLNWEDNAETHKKLLSNMLIVEGLACLDKLTSQSVEFIALPLKLEGLDGCPVRAIAIER